MAKIYIDGKAYEVRDGDNLLAAALGHGLDLPYFCWHPALGSVGACRQCAVKQYKDADDQRGRLVMACMTPVSEGARFAIEEKEVREFRASVIEWLMLNHPHDCPVCDEGGECHLQDMTVMTGHVYRRAHQPKRTYVSQNLGPFITHEMNRCIACYRCVRFYGDYAGGADLHAFASKDHVYFGRHEDGALESPFSGNLVEVCPTGVFTDKTLARHYTRKWDLQSAPSICTHCGVGCNVFAAERYGSLRRIVNRYHHGLNGYFICDRGRFGYEYVNGADRMLSPAMREARGSDLRTATAEALLAELSKRLQGKRLIGIGSPRASLEGNLALRHMVGAENFFSGLGRRAHTLAERATGALRTVRTPSLAEVERCDAVLVLGEDPEATNPRLALSLRQSLRGAALKRADELEIPRWQDASVRDATAGIRHPLYVFSPLPGALDGLARHVGRYRPEQITTLAGAIVQTLQGNGQAIAAEWRALAAEVAETLRAAERPLVVAGGVDGEEATVAAAQAIVAALGESAGLIVTAAEANTVGAALIAGRPLEQIEVDGDSALLIMENDLFRRAPADWVQALLDRAGLVVVADVIGTRTTACADLILPAAAFAESSGIYINYEGRAQRAFQVYVPEHGARPAWRWWSELGAAIGRTAAWESSGALLGAVIETLPELAPLLHMTPTVPESWQVARQSHRASGRTAIIADKRIHEPPPPRDPESPFTFSMEGFGGPVPAALSPRYWAPGWNSWQSVNFYQREIGGLLKGGEAGVCLLHPVRAPQRWTPPVEPAPARWRAIPLHHLFGSEELSGRAPAVAARSPTPCAALNPEDADELGVVEGEALEIALGDHRFQLPVRLLPMARGVVAISAGMGTWGGVPLPAPVKLRRPS